MSVSIDIELKRASKIYHEGENVSGLIILSADSDVKHDGIHLTMEGSVNLQLSSKTVGIIEAFYNSVKPIQLIQYTVDVAPAGKIPSGKTEIPFELPLRPKGNKTFYETYHGVFVNIQYQIHCDIKRNFLAKDISKSLLFIVEDRPEKVVENEHSKKIVFFKITPESVGAQLTTARQLPKFCITGRLDTLYCKLSEPLTGEIVVEHSSSEIKSIELQLVRVETCGCAEGYSRDATEIQNIQFGQGDVPRGIAIPIYMIFPRLFTCPTLSTSSFKVEFEVNIIVVMKGVYQPDFLVTENFSIILSRN